MQDIKKYQYYAQEAAKKIPADSYGEWNLRAFELSDLGEEGRELFHTVSQPSPKYNREDCDKYFNEILKSRNGKRKIASFVKYCHDVLHVEPYREGGDKTSTSKLPERERLIVNEQTVVAPADPALKLKGAVLLLRGELGTLVALPGQGKTAVCEELIAAHHDGTSETGFQFIGEGKKCLLIDTERIAGQVKDSYKNIKRRVKSPKVDSNGNLIGLTCMTVAEEPGVETIQGVLERELSTGEYDFVILDGVLDFVNSMNEETEAMKVVKWLRALAVRYRLAIVVTMHPNKGTEMMAGHLGAFLYRWGRFVLLIRANKSNRKIKEITGDFQQVKTSHADPAELPAVFLIWDDLRKMLVGTEYAGAKLTVDELTQLRDKVFETHRSPIPSRTALEAMIIHHKPKAGRNGKRDIVDAMVQAGLLQAYNGKGKAICYAPNNTPKNAV